MISVGLGQKIYRRLWIKLLVLIDLLKDSIFLINNDEKEKDIQNFFRKYIMMILKWMLFVNLYEQQCWNCWLTFESTLT